ncbi:MAG: type III-B CRISPR-associated protein Cas10/Cmr2 [Azoarcus sp.]|jgi:CRISPR-associated protein Cmr2|nr:type III-B CRISPR-associated protein Cas10/Cmr2 [Azoarcus sp.]
MSEEVLWQTKVAARLHDPAEKALVLFRDPAGHEGGTVFLLKQKLGLKSSREVQWADWWAAGADRPGWPKENLAITTRTGEQKTIAVDEADVRWTKEPVFIHPLTGQQHKLGTLADTDFHDIKERSHRHIEELLGKLDVNPESDNEADWRKILLAFWRFGHEIKDENRDERDEGEIGNLWSLLPADTRIPDHSIWDHLDLTSAFAGAFAADPQNEAALLALSIGPVQDFIAAARSTSDLWAGSHLLSRLAWEAMRPLCETLGPDAILFPRLRGIPQVDLWLRDEMKLPDSLFQNCEWKKGATDANPLFSAALPNRFVAVVPASRVRELAEKCQATVRAWLQEEGREVLSRLLAEADYDVETTSTPYEQMREQLRGFPEVHWAAVPFSLIRADGKGKVTDTSALKAAMSPFFGIAPDEEGGFLKSPAWQVLQQEIDWGDGTKFFTPNPGVLYPAVYELAERALAAAKSARVFDQQKQEGWRCSLTGEAEWLTANREQLKKSYRQRTDTLWAKIAARKPAWAKKGEHLSALPAIKRLWPTIFAEEVGKALNSGDDGAALPVGRFVVSTHTMALAHQLDAWLEKGGLTETGLTEQLKGAESVALPRKLLQRHWPNPDALRDAKRIPGLLDRADENNDEAARQNAERGIKKTLEADNLETYYALIMMDGDRMGEMLSGDGESHITFRESFHPKVKVWFDKVADTQPLIEEYGKQKRPVSPNRHLAISGALNDFSQTVVRHVIEYEHLGRVLYAGGDDVLAMLPVADLLPAMQRLRQAYSGACPEGEKIDWKHIKKKKNTLTCGNGFAWLNGRLMRMMGKNATASCGAVIAHHLAPLAAVMRELRTAEKRAKNEGGRNAFSITVIKRSGGTLYLTEKWGEAVATLEKLIVFLRAEDVSRRAVYHTLEWLKDLPEPGDGPELLQRMLAFQLDRQSGKQGKSLGAARLAKQLTELVLRRPKDKQRKWLENFLTVGEFLAREIRSTLVDTKGAAPASGEKEGEAA